MSPVLKCLLGLFVVLCFVQFIEMARIPRDDNAANDLAAKLSELGSSLNKIFQEEAGRFKDRLFDKINNQYLSQLDSDAPNNR